MMFPKMREDGDKKPLDIYQKLAAGTAIVGILFLLVWSIYDACNGR